MLIRSIGLGPDCGFAWRDLLITVDSVPDLGEFIFRAIDMGRGCTLYVGELPNSILTVQYFHDPSNETGFCGGKFVLNMKDGTQVTIKGPWSSNCSTLNKYCPELASCNVILYEDKYACGFAGYNVKRSAFKNMCAMVDDAEFRQYSETRFYAVASKPENELVNELGDILTERPTVQDLMNENDEEY